MGRGEKTSEMLLCHMKTQMNSVLRTEQFRELPSPGPCLQRGAGKRILCGKLSIAHCQSLPGITQPGARGHSQISKETKLLKIPTDGLQSAGHRQEGSERALWMLGVPKNYQLHKNLEENSAVEQKGGKVLLIST